MAMAMDLCFSNFSYSTTAAAAAASTESTDGGCCWNDWSPVVDWEALPGGRDDFHNLIDSMIDENVVLQQPIRHSTPEGYNNLSPEYNIATDDETTSGGDDLKGLRLIHLLMAAAEAMTGANKCPELAMVILVRLKELVSPVDGTNMERLVAYFTNALQALLDGAANGNQVHGGGSHHYKEEHHQTDILAAFQLLQDMSPYVKFGHLTANQAILEAVTYDRRIHIVDYDIVEGIQWASLMQALVSRKDGPPTPHLRITAVSWGGSGRRSFGNVQETGRRLIAFAASIG